MFYNCLLDARKAFDKVHFGKLFNILLNQIVPFWIIRLLMGIYVRQMIRVMWNSYIFQSLMRLKAERRNFTDDVKPQEYAKLNDTLLSWEKLFKIFFDRKLVNIVDSFHKCSQFIGQINNLRSKLGHLQPDFSEI